MPKRTIPLTELVPLFRQMTSPTWEDGRLCGELTVADQSMADLLSELLHEDHADDYPCVVEQGDPDRIRVGDLFRLQFGKVRTGVGLIVRDVDSLLRNSHVAANIGEHIWYVQSIDTASWEAEKELCRRLSLVGKLVHALEGAASIFDHRTATLVFLRSGGRFDVPIRYGEEDLMRIDERAAEHLIAQLELDDGHAAQRHQIGATAVCELLASLNREKRFAELLQHVDELNQRFVDGYRLFASSFSYEKLRDEAQALRIEFSGRIHKTISDIQGQLLGIPISTVVVATQFKPIGVTPWQLWINGAVLVGAVIFFLLMLLSVWNQMQTLGVLESEIDRHENALREEHADIAERLDGVFTGLRNRAFWHRVALIGVTILCAFGLLVGFTVFHLFQVIG